MSDDNGSFDKRRIKKVQEWLNLYFEDMTSVSMEELTLEESDSFFKNSTQVSEEDNWSQRSSLKVSHPNYMDLEEVKDLQNNDFNGLCVEDVVKLRLVLKRNVLGMTLDEFQTIYRTLFGRPLHSHGFKSIIEMLHNMNSVFFLESIHTEDPRLSEDDVFTTFLIHDFRHRPKPITKYDKHLKKVDFKTIPESVQIFWFNVIKESVSGVDLYKCRVDFKYLGFESKLEFFERLSNLIPIEINDCSYYLTLKPLSEVETFVSDLISKQNYDFCQNINYPDIPVLKPGAQIPDTPIEMVYNKLEGQIKPIYISSIRSFESFSGILIEDEFFCLWKEMDDHYSIPDYAPDMYKVPQMFLVSGLVCAALCSQNGWIRAKIIKIKERSDDQNGELVKHFKLKAIDFGYNFKAKHKDLRLLDTKFAEMSAKLIEFRLNGINKVKKSNLKKLLFKFRTKRPETPDDELFCQFVNLRDNKIEIIVFETEDLHLYYSIAEKLIEKNFAEKSENFVSPDWDLLYTTVQLYYKL